MAVANVAGAAYKADDEKLIKDSLDMLYLISCALHKKCPSAELVSEMDLEGVYKTAEFHSLQAITYSGLEPALRTGCDAPRSLSEQTRERWDKLRSAVIRKNLMFDFEREKLIAFMEEQGIWYMPMKGIVLSRLYPTMGWRQMADNDILFDARHREKIRDFMLGMGYEAARYDMGVHDIYKKPPYYNFEMHVAFYKSAHGDPEFEAVYKYYRSFEQLLIRDGEETFAHHLSDEDFYLYMTSHAFKHFRFGGTGLRTFLDFYVYLSSKGDSLDREYIDKVLEKTFMTGFEARIRSLAMKLFSKDRPSFSSDAGLSDEERALVLLHTKAGTYGTLEGEIATRLDSMRSNGGRITAFTKLKYCLRRAVPSMEYYRNAKPFLYKYKIFIPGFVVLRILKAVFLMRNIGAELKILWDTSTIT